MDLSMILNNDGGGYESSPAPSPRSPVRASTRWSVDEMRSAVAILSDFQPPAQAAAVDDDETEDEQDMRRPRRQQTTSAPAPPPASAESERGFSGLDLLFQADAMIQKRVSPELRPSKATKKRPVPETKSSMKKSSRPQPLATPVDEDDDDEEEPESSPKYMRSGFWTRAEEEYAAALIFYFLRGALPIAEGTTLRKYLAEQLSCNRRRVSMKLATETIADKKIPRKVGASVFVALKPTPSDADRQEVDDILGRLRRDCFREMEAQLEKPSGRDSPVSPLLLGAKSHKNEPGSPSDVSLGTPSRRKSPKKQRRPSVSSTNSKPSPPHIKRRRPLIIRTGFDSPQEEEYVTAMIEYFTEGTLELAEDMRLVTYLCEQLEVSAKILSMKLAPRKMGERKFPENIGSITFTRKEDDDVSSEIFEAEAHVFELRQNWMQARDEAEEADDDTEPEEKPALATPVLTPARKVKAETTPVLSSSRTATPPHVKKEKESPTYARSGPWSRHEEEFAAGLIDCFFRGVLDITEGTTLRAYLTSRLKCNPMRISKKLASHTIADVKIPKKLGSATYVQRDGVSDEERRSAEEHLQHLEHLSLAEQHLKEDMLVRVIGNKHSRDEEPEEYEPEPAYNDAHPRGLFHGRSHSYEHEYNRDRDHYRGGHVRHTSHVAGPLSPRSPFKMRSHVVDDYNHHAPPPPQHPPHRRSHGHGHARPSSTTSSPYDHHDASMRYQRVAY